MPTYQGRKSIWFSKLNNMMNCTERANDLEIKKGTGELGE